MRKAILSMFFVFVCILSAYIPGDASVDPSDYQFKPEDEINRNFDPEKGIGDITKKSTEKQLQDAYGRGNVTRIALEDENGRMNPVSRVHLSENETVDVFWSNEDFTEVWRVVITNSADVWSEDKVKIGMSLSELEDVNGGAFKLIGFSRDLLGVSTSWEGGMLSSNLKVEMRPFEKQDYHENILTEKPKEYSTTNDQIKMLKLVVTKIIIEW